MSVEEHKNGDGREPDKKPEIGRDDVQNLIDFGDSDDEEEIEESEEGSESIEMQVVDEAAQLLASDDNSDEIEEVDGGLPEVLYDFDPEIQGVESPEESEQVVVEQQVLDLAGVLIEMVEEGSENQLEEGPDQGELACKTEEEAPPQRLMVLHGQEGNSSNQGQEEPTGIREPSNQSSGNESLESVASGDNVIVKDRIGEPSSSGHDPNDRSLNGELSEQGSNEGQNGGSSSSGPSSNDDGQNGGSSSSGPSSNDDGQNGGLSSSGPSSNDGQNGGSSSSGPGSNDQDQNEPSGLGQGPVDRNLNEMSSECLNRCLKEGPSEYGQGLSDEIRNGRQSRSRQGSNNEDRNRGSSRPLQGLYQSLNEEQSRLSQVLKVGPSESGQGPADEVQNDGLRSGQSSSDQDRNCRPPRLRQGPVVDLNEGQSGSSQGLKGPSEPFRGPFDQNRNDPSLSGGDIVEQDVEEGLDQGAFVQRVNEQQSTSYGYNGGSYDRVSNKGLNGGPSRPGEDPVEQQIREGEVGACEDIMELELNEDEIEVNDQARPILGLGIPERDIGFRCQIVEAANAVAQQEMAVDLNGEPDSGPDPGEQREKVEQAAANEGAVAPPEVAVGRPEDHIDVVPDQNEDILLDEQDNLVEEVQILHAPLEGAVGRQDHVVVEEQDASAEAQLIQKTE